MWVAAARRLTSTVSTVFNAQHPVLHPDAFHPHPNPKPEHSSCLDKDAFHPRPKLPPAGLFNFLYPKGIESQSRPRGDPVGSVLCVVLSVGILCCSISGLDRLTSPRSYPGKASRLFAPSQNKITLNLAALTVPRVPAQIRSISTSQNENILKVCIALLCGVVGFLRQHRR